MCSREPGKNVHGFLRASIIPPFGSSAMAGDHGLKSMRFDYHEKDRVNHLTGWRYITTKRPKIGMILRKRAEETGADNPEYVARFGQFLRRQLFFALRGCRHDAKVGSGLKQERDLQQRIGRIFDNPGKGPSGDCVCGVGMAAGMTDVSVQAECVISGDVEETVLLGQEGLFSRYEITFNELCETVELEEMRVYAS